MQKGRCRYPANLLVRVDLDLRERAGEVLRREGTTLSAYVRDRLREVVSRRPAGAMEARP